MEPVILGPDEGERLDIHGTNVMTFKALPADTDGRYTMCRYEAAPSWPGTAVHTHPDFEEAFFVLEGEFEFEVAGQTVQAVPGTFLLVPRGVEHAFRNPTDKPASLLGIFSPPGAEEGFRRRANK
jgi:quercetin dioxygenase-like cupin family protein